MLLIENYIAPSPINGTGLFAGQDIPKDTLIWRYDPRFDTEFTPDQADQLPPLAQAYVKTYAALSTISGKYILSSDNARFTNHSDYPNVIALQEDGEMELITRAARDIQKGEEITVDYTKIDKVDAEQGAKYLK